MRWDSEGAGGGHHRSESLAVRHCAVASGAKVFIVSLEHAIVVEEKKEKGRARRRRTIALKGKEQEKATIRHRHKIVVRVEKTVVLPRAEGLVNGLMWFHGSLFASSCAAVRLIPVGSVHLGKQVKDGNAACVMGEDHLVCIACGLRDP